MIVNLTTAKDIDRRKFHFFTLALSLFFLFLTAAFTDMGAPEPSVFWYASNLHWAFWPGLLFSGLAIILSIKNRRRYLGLASITLPVFFLYALPHYVHDMVPVFDVYHVIPARLALIEAGHLESTLFRIPALYQSTSIITSGMDPMDYARFFPVILAFTITIFIYTFARRISTRWAPVAPLTFLAFNWYMEYHLAKQSFGIIIWIAFWLILFLYLEKKDYRLAFLAVPTLIVLLISHPGMLIITSFNFIALLVAMIVSYRDKIEWNYLKPLIPIFLFLGIFFMISFYFVPRVDNFFTSHYEGLRDTLFNSPEFSLGGPATTSSQYAFVNRLRMSTGIIQSLLAFSGFIALYKFTSKRALFLGAWFFSIHLWLIYPLTHEGLYIERAFLSALIPASILTVALLKHGEIKYPSIEKLSKTLLIIVLIAFLITIPITKNSADSIETPSLSSYQGARFAQENIEGRLYVTDMHFGMFRYLRYEYDSEVIFTRSGKRPQDQPYGYSIPRTDRTELSPLLFTDYFNNYIEIRYGNTTAVDQIHTYEEELNDNTSRIYDSGGSRIYV